MRHKKLCCFLTEAEDEVYLPMFSHYNNSSVQLIFINNAFLYGRLINKQFLNCLILEPHHITSHMYNKLDKQSTVA